MKRSKVLGFFSFGQATSNSSHVDTSKKKPFNGSHLLSNVTIRFFLFCQLILLFRQTPKNEEEEGWGGREIRQKP